MGDVIALLARGLAAVNLVAGWITDAIVTPLALLHPMVGLGVVSVLTAIPALLVVRQVSDQPRIAALKRAIAASLFECRLFQDDLVAVFRAQGELLARNLAYLRLSMVPMVWLALPFGIAFVQLDAYYGYEGAHVGRPVLVTAALEPGGVLAGVPTVTLVVPEHVRVLDAPAWFPSTGEVMWRVEPEREGTFELGVQMGGRTVAKAFNVSDAVARRSPRRSQHGLLERLTWPSEPPIEDGSPVSSVTIAYQSRQFSAFGWYVPWWVPYAVMVVLASFISRRWLRVTL